MQALKSVIQNIGISMFLLLLLILLNNIGNYLPIPSSENQLVVVTAVCCGEVVEEGIGNALDYAGYII